MQANMLPHTCVCERTHGLNHLRDGWKSSTGEIMNKALQGSTAKVVDGSRDVYKSKRAIYAGSLGH